MVKDVKYKLAGVDVCNTRAFEDRFVKNCFVITCEPFLDALIVEQQETMECLAGCELLPTYAYSRIYWPGSVLPKHTDRESCEVSATICIDSDPDPWPIFVGREKYILEPGDMLVYKGINLAHWRDAYTGNRHIQIFIHYVEKNGKYSEYKYDKRPCLGHPYQNRRQ